MEIRDELYDIRQPSVVRIIERASLPAEEQKKFYSDWLVAYPSGYVAGVSTEQGAMELVEQYHTDIDRHTKLHPYNSPVWNWFSLSYCSYLVIPRAVLCAMPFEWQERFVKLVEEVDETIEWPETGDYAVQLRDERGRFTTDPLANYKYYDRALIKDKRKDV